MNVKGIEDAFLGKSPILSNEMDARPIEITHAQCPTGPTDTGALLYVLLKIDFVRSASQNRTTSTLVTTIIEKKTLFLIVLQS